MDAKREFERMVKRYHVVKIRSKRHDVYRLPNGRTFGTSQTPNCPFAWHHALDDLCDALEIPRLREPKGLGNRGGRIKPKAKSDLRKVPFTDIAAKTIEQAFKDRLAKDNDFVTLMRLEGVQPIERKRA